MEGEPIDAVKCLLSKLTQVVSIRWAVCHMKGPMLLCSFWCLFFEILVVIVSLVSSLSPLVRGLRWSVSLSYVRLNGAAACSRRRVRDSIVGARPLLQKQNFDFLTSVLHPCHCVLARPPEHEMCAHDAADACSRMPRRNNLLAPQRSNGPSSIPRPDTTEAKTLQVEPQRTPQQPQRTSNVNIKTNSPHATSDSTSQSATHKIHNTQQRTHNIHNTQQRTHSIMHTQQQRTRHDRCERCSTAAFPCTARRSQHATRNTDTSGNTYIHTCMHACMHACMHTYSKVVCSAQHATRTTRNTQHRHKWEYIHTYMHACMHTYSKVVCSAQHVTRHPRVPVTVCRSRVCSATCYVTCVRFAHHPLYVVYTRKAQTGRGQVRLKPQRRRAPAPSAHEGAQNHRTRRLLKLATQVEDLVTQFHRRATMLGGLSVVPWSMLSLWTKDQKSGEGLLCEARWDVVTLHNFPSLEQVSNLGFNL